jgi:hypothetical protein
MRWRKEVWACAAVLLMAGCGADDDTGEAASRGGTTVPGADGVFNGTNTGAGGTSPGAPFGNGSSGGVAGGMGSGTPPPLPPEVEVRMDFERPQASERYVYAANPVGGTVSIIDAESLTIQTLETGSQPTFLRTLAGTDDAIVLNVGSDDASIIRSPDSGARLSTVDVVDGANAIAVAPDGEHAVVYFDSAFSTAGGGSGSFQDVTVLSLADGGDEATDMTVGFRPRDVFFSADGSRGYVVTEDGVSVLDFEEIEAQGTGIAELISLGADIDQQSADVSITPDGRFALAREPGQSQVRLVTLADGSIATLDLAELLGADTDDGSDADAGVDLPPTEAVTDLDLSPDGSFALAVVREEAAVLRIPVPGGFDDPEAVDIRTIEGELIGSVTIAPDAEEALLYTTAAMVERITVLPLSGDDEPRTVQLRKAVQSVSIASDGQTALIVHTKAEGDPNQPGITPDAQIDRSFGYSVMNVTDGAVKLQVTPTPPTAFTLVPDGSQVFVLFRDDATGVREVQKVESRSFLVEPIRLGSPPVSLGAVPQSQRVFVGQEHPDGRITFIDWNTAESRTVTGFELNSRIRD